MQIGKIKSRTLITNRGPNYKTLNGENRSAGGTGSAYKYLAEQFSEEWFFLNSDIIKGKIIDSSVCSKIRPIFINNIDYSKYYYGYVSNYFYPTLLLCDSDKLSNYEQDYDDLMGYVYGELKNIKNNRFIVCDYHLHGLLPHLKEKSKKIIYFWFIPFFEELSDNILHRKIVKNMSYSDVIVFLDKEYADGYVNSFKKYYPSEILHSSIEIATLGPDDVFNYGKIGEDNLKDKNNMPKSIQKIFNSGYEYFLSVSRMDMVKDIPTAIRAFDFYLDNKISKNIYFIIIAPHHRPDSNLYKTEEDKIRHLIINNKYVDNIVWIQQPLDKLTLIELYKKAKGFLCTSRFDGMPITAIEFMMSNGGQGNLYVSDGCGVSRLYPGLSTIFKSGDRKELGNMMIRHDNISLGVNTYNKYLNISQNVCLKEWGAKIELFINS